MPAEQKPEKKVSLKGNEVRKADECNTCGHHLKDDHSSGCNQSGCSCRVST